MEYFPPLTAEGLTRKKRYSPCDPALLGRRTSRSTATHRGGARAPTRRSSAGARRQRGVPRPGGGPGGRRRGRGGRRGGAVHPAQARQRDRRPSPRGSCPSSAAALVPGAGRARPGRPRRRRLLLRPGALGAGRGARARRPVGPPARSSTPGARPSFLATALPGLDPDRVRFVPHHVAHAASAALAGAVPRRCASLVLDGRGERASHLAGRYRDGELEVLAGAAAARTRSACSTRTLTDHLGFHRSSDEYKVMALASYGQPAPPRPTSPSWSAPPATAGSCTEPIDWDAYAPRADGGRVTARRRRTPTSPPPCSAGSRRCCSSWPAGCTTRTGERCLTHGRRRRAELRRERGAAPRRARSTTSGCSRPPVTPAPRSGAALHVAREADGASGRPMTTAALGRGWTDDEIEASLRTARRAVRAARRPRRAPSRTSSPPTGVVAWFQGRSRVRPARPRASARCWPTRATSQNLERLNDVKGREQFRPVAPHGARRAGGRDLRRRTAAQPVHAVRARRRPRVARAHPGGRARRRHGAGPDRRPRDQPLLAGRARRLRGAHRPAGRGQHQPQHRRPADGRRPARRARAVRLGPGRRAGDRAVPGAPRTTVVARARGRAVAEHARRRCSTYAVVVPTVGRPSLALLLGSLAAQAHRARPRWWSSTTGRRQPPAPRRSTSRTAAGRAGPAGGGRGPAPPATSGGGTRDAPWVGFLDDDVVLPATWSRASGRRPRAARDRAAGGSQAPRAGAAARRTGARPTGSGRRTGLERAGGSPPTWPTAETPGGGAAASTSASRAPSARTPTSPLRVRGGGLTARAGTTGTWCTRSGRADGSAACAASAATPTTP